MPKVPGGAGLTLHLGLPWGASGARDEQAPWM